MASTVTQKIDSYFSQYPKRIYPKGQILIFAHNDPEHIFYILKGKVRKYDVSYRGDEVVVNIYKPPAFFPMSWAISHTPNKYLYKTETETVVHIAPPDATLEFVKANPDVLLDLVDRLYIGTEGLLGRMVRLMSGTARSRLIYELIIECRRFGEEDDKGCHLLSASESDIAARSGLSRETVSREMKKLKRDDLICVDNKGIHINNLPALEEKLGTEI